MTIINVQDPRHPVSQRLLELNGNPRCDGCGSFMVEGVRRKDQAPVWVCPEDGRSWEKGASDD